LDGKGLWHRICDERSLLLIEPSKFAGTVEHKSESEKTFRGGEAGTSGGRHRSSEDSDMQKKGRNNK